MLNSVLQIKGLLSYFQLVLLICANIWNFLLRSELYESFHYLHISHYLQIHVVYLWTMASDQRFIWKKWHTDYTLWHRAVILYRSVFCLMKFHSSFITDDLFRCHIQTRKESIFQLIDTSLAATCKCLCTRLF